MLKSIRYLVITAFCVFNINLFSQETYITEFGFHGGASYFLGDVRVKPFDFQTDYGFLFRRLFNQRLSLQAEFGHTAIQGNYRQRKTLLSPREITINQKINTLDFTFAFNFFDYVKLDYMMKSSNHTPYIFLGAGMLHSYSGNKHHLAATLPVGLGYKVLLSKRLHLNAQWTHRLMLADNIEGNPDLNNALALNGTNILNNDHLGTITIGLSYSMFREKCDCLNYK